MNRDNTAVPLYRQVHQQILTDIADGRLSVGCRLPSSRQLAHDLGISRMTVASAYRALESEGVIETRERSGTFVSPRPPLPSSLPDVDGRSSPLAWEARLCDPFNSSRGEMLDRLLCALLREGSIPFCWGAGDPSLFPVDEFRIIINRILRRHGTAALGCEQTQGYAGLRHALAHYLSRLGIPATADGLVITAGSQQAISLIAETLLEPGDGVVVESPTWMGALEAFSASGARLIGIPVDREGMCTHQIEKVLMRERPRLIYSVPTFHNPTGTVMSAARRRELVALAGRYGVPILEDDALREVRYGNLLPKPLAALDTGGNVINIGSFTKALLPAARIGYLAGPPRLRDAIIERKRWSDMFCSPLMQHALCAYLESGQAVRYWKRINRIYARRQKAMLDALHRHFPGSARWHSVGGGPQLWVRAPAGVSVIALFALAAYEGVPFVPGESLFVTPADQPYMRLNFAAVDEARIEQGIARLGKLMKSSLSARTAA